MKTTFALICTSLVLSNARAQLGGVFNQKENDLKSVGQQIALLELYAGWLQRGYRIAEEGLSTIGHQKQDDLDLHADFYARLKWVNPYIKKDQVIDRVVSDQLTIVSVLTGLSQVLRLTQSETDFLKERVSLLLSQAEEGINEVNAVRTNDVLGMSDEERMSRIEEIAHAMQHTKISALHLSQEVHLLSANRAGEQADLETQKALVR